MCGGTGGAAVVFPPSAGAGAPVRGSGGAVTPAAKMEAVTEGSWSSLPVPLSPGVLQALRELRFHQMTPVQVRGLAAQPGKGRPG